jgi:uncharacterized protein
VQIRATILLASTVAAAATAAAQPADTGRRSSDSVPPVIDVHMHALGAAGTTAMRATMDSLNVRYAVFIGTPTSLATERAGSARLIPALTFPCEGGRMPNSGVTCFPDEQPFPTVAALREMIAGGTVKVLGELNAQYMGIMPNDPALEPYFALAEELDVPVGIHLGFAAPGVAYAANAFPSRKSPKFRGDAGRPLPLEDVLVKHPKLRAYVMHAAWPFLDEMTYLLAMHPQLYVDVSVLQYAIPRPAYYRYLAQLVEAGFGKRIMFGSDGSGRRLREGIDALTAAPFLSAEQKRDILHDNAVRFLRLPAQ